MVEKFKHPDSKYKVVYEFTPDEATQANNATFTAQASEVMNGVKLQDNDIFRLVVDRTQASIVDLAVEANAGLTINYHD